MSGAAPSRQAVLGLFRGLLRTARHFEDYNYRSYAKRRVKLGFQQNKAAAGDALVKEYQEGVKQLNMLKRQTTLSHLYPPKKSVMEMGGRRG